MTDMLGPMILTGPTGGLGSRILHHLLHTLSIPSSQIILSTSSESSAATLSSVHPDATVRHGDFLSPSTLPSTFAGGHTLCLISYPSIAYEQRVAAHKNAIDAAITAGVKRIVYTSLAFASDSDAAVMKAHLKTESYLKRVCGEKGVTYTIVREGIYSESWPLYMGFWKDGEDEVVMPNETGNAGVAWVARDELGEGTARILVDESEEFRDKIVLLSGKEAIGFEELAKMVGSAIGKEVKVSFVDMEKWVSVQTKRRGGGEEEEKFVREWGTTFPAIGKGELEAVDPLLEQLLGRKRKSLEDCVKEMFSKEGQADRETKQYAK